MKLWALNVCVACILAGALDLFLPRQGSFKSIKTVLALYILVSVVTPAAGADWTGLASLSFESDVQPADYSDYVSGYACQSLAGQLVYPDVLQGKTVTYRDIVREFTEGHPWARFGFFLCLGVDADRPITLEQAMFAPGYLQKAFADARVVNGAGGTRPLVSKTEVLVPAEPSEAASQWGKLLTPFACSLILLLIVACFFVWSIRRKKECWLLNAVLFTAAGLAGCILFFLAVFSSHPAVDKNYVLLFLHPGHLLFTPYVIYCVLKRKKCWYLELNTVVLMFFIILLPLMPQKFDPAIVPLACCLLLCSASHLIANHKKKV